ncbi:hypothetical protein [Methanospirillum hungatei]|uniref:hypothetical protein n=1 Tax=Methanospirillum hungatei TaxID=2203 RepID=UPI0026F30440|nr:hypothetical protein [Methanospirillum hungatei]MCA1916244.1 hypothetical protein [Methanospirillum hungatei]
MAEEKGEHESYEKPTVSKIDDKELDNVSGGEGSENLIGQCIYAGAAAVTSCKTGGAAAHACKTGGAAVN